MTERNRELVPDSGSLVREIPRSQSTAARVAGSRQRLYTCVTDSMYSFFVFFD